MKHNISESQRLSAKQLADALGGRKVGNEYMARCPSHHDRKPSLAIKEGDDGKVLVHCHAGCTQGRVISSLREQGLWAANGARSGTQTAARLKRPKQPSNEQTGLPAPARAIIQSSIPAAGTPVEIYLRSRGIAMPPPPALRFVADLRHRSGGQWPGMVALVTRNNDVSPIAIHRTFLARDGSGKAQVEPNKMMLGPSRGGAVRLAEAGDTLMIGEGIETCLSAMQIKGHPAWAALSTSGLRALHLPTGIRKVIVLADGDDAGIGAAHDCANRLRQQGRRVRIECAPPSMDYNDVLLGRRSSGEGAVS